MSEFDPSPFTLVVVESPYAGDIALNVAYARACMADCLARGEAPYASHLLYTQPGVLRDEVPEERTKGIAAGFAWGDKAVRRAVYTDLGMSSGMLAGIKRAEAITQPVEFRELGLKALVAVRKAAELEREGARAPLEVVALQSHLELSDVALNAARHVVAAACRAFDPERPEAMPEHLNRAIYLFVKASAEALAARGGNA